MYQKPMTLFLIKKGKQFQTNIDHLLSTAHDPVGMQVSTRLGASFLLSLTLFITVLLVGNAFQIERTAAQVPNSVKSYRQEVWENHIARMTTGYPIAKMLPNIFQYDHKTVAYIIGIGKKESNWGKISPTQYDEDCYNYWGYTAPGTRGLAAGHGCFGSREEAVQSVANQLETYLYEDQYQTPKQLVVWKCGYTCAGHSPTAVRKWISDVAYYTDQLDPARTE